MLRLAASLAMIAAPVQAAVTCDEYEQLMVSATLAALEATGCADMADEAEQMCFTHAMLSAHPSTLPIWAMTQDEAYLACFPEHRPPSFTQPELPR